MMFLLWNALVFIFVIGALVFVHEFGHFIVAKMFGVGVLRFSLGFGRPIVRKQVGETMYQICWIPLGGYVRMVGDESASKIEDSGADPQDDDYTNSSPVVQAMIKDETRWFVHKGLFARSAIVAAGPIFNFVFAVVALTFNIGFYGLPEINPDPVIGRVFAEQPAHVAGIKVNDMVVSINNKPIKTWIDLAERIHESNGVPMHMKLLRDSVPMALTITPQAKEIKTPSGTQILYLIGIQPEFKRIAIPIVRAPGDAVGHVYRITAQTYEALWGMFSGKVSPTDIAGPVFIFNIAGERANQGAEALIDFMVLLSVSLAVLNLLPIPVLDGGHLLFFLIEALIGPIADSRKEFAQQMGMFALLALMTLAVCNDLFLRAPSDSSISDWKEAEESSTDPDISASESSASELGAH